MFYYMYEIRNNLNGKIYVGVHKTNNMNDGYMGSGKIIKNAIKKHGIDNFTKVIIETFENSELMYAKEKQIVSEKFVDRNDTYNLAVGGSGGSILQNRKSWPKGKSHSSETIEKMRISATGKTHSEESIRKMKENSWAKRSPVEQHNHSIKAGKLRWEYSDSLQREESCKKISGSVLELNRVRKENDIPHPVSGIKREVYICPHCQKRGAMNTMSRFHFNNCKSLVIESEVVEPTVRETVY